MAVVNEESDGSEDEEIEEHLLAAVSGDVDVSSDEAESHVRLRLLGQGYTAKQAMKGSRKRPTRDP